MASCRVVVYINGGLEPGLELHRTNPSTDTDEITLCGTIHKRLKKGDFIYMAMIPDDQKKHYVPGFGARLTVKQEPLF